MTLEGWQATAALPKSILGKMLKIDPKINWKTPQQREL